MRNPQERARRPEIILQDLLRKHAKGQLVETTKNNQPFLRATVLAVDNIGGKLSNPDGSGVVSSGGRDFKAIVGPENPPGSVKARLISKGLDRFVTEQEAGVFWPFMQSDHLSIPVKVGEHVYVMFEDAYYEHGLWLCRVPGHTGANLFEGKKSFDGNIQRKASEFFEPQEKDEMDDAYAADSVEHTNLSELF